MLLTLFFHSNFLMDKIIKNKWGLELVTSLNDRNGIRTHNNLVRKQTLNYFIQLAKWLSCVVSTYLYGAFDFEVLAHIHQNFLLYFFVCQVPNTRVPSSKWLDGSKANSAFHPTLNQMFCFRLQNMPRVTWWWLERQMLLCLF